MKQFVSICFMFLLLLSSCQQEPNIVGNEPETTHDATLPIRSNLTDFHQAFSKNYHEDGGLRIASDIGQHEGLLFEHLKPQWQLAETFFHKSDSLIVTRVPLAADNAITRVATDLDSLSAQSYHHRVNRSYLIEIKSTGHTKPTYHFMHIVPSLRALDIGQWKNDTEGPISAVFDGEVELYSLSLKLEEVYIYALGKLVEIKNYRRADNGLRSRSMSERDCIKIKIGGIVTDEPLYENGKWVGVLGHYEAIYRLDCPPKDYTRDFESTDGSGSLGDNKSISVGFGGGKNSWNKGESPQKGEKSSRIKFGEKESPCDQG